MRPSSLTHTHPQGGCTRQPHRAATHTRPPAGGAHTHARPTGHAASRCIKALQHKDQETRRDPSTGRAKMLASTIQFTNTPRKPHTHQTTHPEPSSPPPPPTATPHPARRTRKTQDRNPAG